MKIIINGQEKEFTSPINLKKVIEQFCKNSQHVIAEVNGTIVKNQSWTEQILSNGDTVELVNFVGGG